MRNQSPFLYFNFANNDGKVTPVQFKEPIRILIAQSIEEVIPCLKKVQDAVNNGLYAAGYLSYEAAAAFDQKLKRNQNTKTPFLWFGIFKEPIIERLHIDYTKLIHDWKPTESKSTYYKNIENIHQHIMNNNTKQVNYTTRFTTPFTDNALSFYKQLEDAQAANYTAYLDLGDQTIVSASPELFFHLKDRTITTKPMKGTIDRGKTYEEDLQKKSWLQQSEKDKIENELIIDLMKYDLSKIAIPNSISILNKFHIEKYPTVYQMTSTIKADIDQNIDLIDIFTALFPCGSITGFPKENTMQIIHDLEQSPREVYCGAIGYITPNNEAIFNVPIRTVQIDNKQNLATYGVGGGITINSIKENEYNEVLAKTKVLTKESKVFNLLESLGLQNGDFIVLQEHLDRLKKSADYFEFKLDIEYIKKTLSKLAKTYNEGFWKVRLLVNSKGDITTEIEEIAPMTGNFYINIAKEPINKDDIYLYHKTTNRTIYNQHRKIEKGVFDTLLWNEDNEVTECTMGNIVVELDGKLYTPPVESGLLAGTYRAALLQKATISERKIYLDELQNSKKIYFINSVRKWIPVQLKH